MLVCATLLLPHCAAPTALTITVYSDIACAKSPSAGLAVGSSFADLKGKAFSSTSLGCAADGKLGSVVVYPSAGAKNGRVAVQVVTRADGEGPESCSPADGYKGCIVAKRELPFVPNQDLQMRIDLRRACEGIPCDEASTCVRGACVAATVECNQVCSEAEIPGAPVLPPSSSDAATTSDAATDAGPGDSANANTPFCQGWTYCDDFEGGGNINWNVYTFGTTSIGIATGTASSGTKAIRHQRPIGGPGTVNEGSMYFAPQIPGPAVTSSLTCEYDVYYASAVPTGTTDHSLSGFRMLGLSGGYTEVQAGIVSAYQGGLDVRWFAVQNGMNTGGRSLPIVAVTRNKWHTVRSVVLLADMSGNNTINGGGVEIDSAPGVGTGKFSFSPVTFRDMTFGIGVYEEGASLPSDVYYDNVRCR
jgi:hypothetical protein